ncbi:MAG: glycosyltransferase, partial [Nitrososphaerales archaeon]
MKICLITPLFEPWLVGGAEKYVSTLADQLSATNDVTVVTTTGPRKREVGVSNRNLRLIELTINNVASLYDILKSSSNVSMLRRAIWHLLDVWNASCYKQIRRVLETEKPNIVHTNGIKGLSASVFTAIKRSGIPHVHTLHDYELISRWSSLFRSGTVMSSFNMLDKSYISCMRSLSSHVNGVISPSQFILDFHTKLGYFRKSEKYVIPNGISLNAGAVAKSRMSKEFLCIGQIAKHKGIQVAIEAFRKINDNEATLHIVGNGDYISTIRELAQ